MVKRSKPKNAAHQQKVTFKTSTIRFKQAKENSCLSLFTFW
jgi:hypothetical protein